MWNGFFDLSYFFFKNKFLLPNFNFSNLCLSVGDCNDLFHNLRYLHYFFYDLCDWNNFLNDSINNIVLNFDMIDNLSGISVLNLRNNFFHNFFDLNDLRHLDNLFNDFFLVSWHLNNFFNDSFNFNDHLFD